MTWTGNETLDESSVHVVVAHSSDRTLIRFSEDRRGPIDLFGPRIEDATLTAWIAEDSGHVRRARLAFDLRSDDACIDSRLTTTFTDSGADVEIALPEAATEDPVELGCPGE